MNVADKNFPPHNKKHEHDWDACPGSYRYVTSMFSRKHARCLVCNRRLLVCESVDEDDGFIAYFIPRHKVKLKRKKITKKERRVRK